MIFYAYMHISDGRLTSGVLGNRFLYWIKNWNNRILFENRPKFNSFFMAEPQFYGDYYVINITTKLLHDLHYDNNTRW